MVGGREVAACRTCQHHTQHDGADQHMRAMESGEHEEGRAVDAGGQPQVLHGVGIPVFVRLQAEEQGAQRHREAQADDQVIAPASLDAPMRPGDRGAGGKQDQGVEGGEAGCFHRVFGNGELAGVGQLQQRPGGDETRPQDFVRRCLVADAAEPGHGEVADVEQRAEKRSEEHHFGENEPGHAPAEADIYLVVVAAALALLDHGAEPAAEHADENQETDAHGEAAAGDVVREQQGTAAGQRE